MAKQTVNLGTMADNKSGDPLRTAFTKINENFTELYNRPTGTADLGKLIISGAVIGTTDDDGGWGGYDIYLAPNGEGYAWIAVPCDISAGNGAALVLGNTHPTGGGVRIQTDGNTWEFGNDGSLQLPADGTIKDSNGNILVSSSTFIDLPEWLIAVAGTNHLPTINSDYGWDSNGVWFTNSTIGGIPDEGTSYPVRLADSIPASQGVVITVDFDADPTSNDFGIGVWETGTTPVWAWGSASGNINIGAQYDGTTPVLKAIAGDGVDVEGRYSLPAAGTYRARLTISPPADGGIAVTLETLDTSNNVLDTISYVEQPFSSSYSIGFAADQDNGTDKTYIKNLVVNINDGDTLYNDTLLSYNSVGTTNTGHFSFADNTVTITGQDMQFITTRDGWDIDCDFDVNAADDVFIEALGDDVGITAANEVTITTSALNMYPNTYYGQEEDFIGTWDGTSLTLNVLNGNTTLITLLTEYVSVSNPIWLKTASGYTKTDTNGNATKTVGGSTTTFEMSLSTTSPVADADIINMKVYDSINNGTYHDFTFTKSGKLQFPSGGVIEPVGMGWVGLTNGTTGNPVSVLAKNEAGTERSSLTLYNSGTYGTAQIYTSFAPGAVVAGDYTVSNSTGSWDANPVTDLGTTGGSGTGLTVNVYQSGSGYAESVTVLDPGSGYVDGETITVTSGNSSTTFTISVVPEQYNEWSFDEEGGLTLPNGTTFIGFNSSTTVTGTVIQVADLATAGFNWTGSPVVDSTSYTNAGWDYIGFDNAELRANLYAQLNGDGDLAVTWSEGSTATSGFVHINFGEGNLFQFVPSDLGASNFVAGTWVFPANIGGETITTPYGTKVTLNNKDWKFDSDGNTEFPGSIKMASVATTGGTTEARTALDLSKSIQKLSDGYYSLADGQEGQIMHLVSSGEINYGMLSVEMAHGRNLLWSGAGWWLFPFIKWDPVANENVAGDGVCTLIFTDGAWQSSTGIWAD